MFKMFNFKEKNKQTVAETTQNLKIDASVRFEEPIHCTQYLVDGELKSWEGGTSEVFSNIYTENSNGDIGPTLLGSILDMETDAALDALNAAEKAFNRGQVHGPQ